MWNTIYYILWQIEAHIFRLQLKSNICLRIEELIVSKREMNVFVTLYGKLVSNENKDLMWKIGKSVVLQKQTILLWGVMEENFFFLYPETEGKAKSV